MARRKKKRVAEKKPRIPALLLDFGRDVTIDGMEDMPDGTIRFWSNGAILEPARVSVAMTHPRGGGKAHKTLSQWPTLPGAIQQHPTQAMARFAHIFAVDTNKVGTACVMCMVHATPPSFEGPAWESKLRTFTPLEFHNPRADSERLGWYLAINAILTTPEYKSGGEVAVVVDSHLGDIDAMNRRTAPFLGTCLLPERITLVYASSDRDPEHLPNKLLVTCDKKATEILSKPASEAPPLLAASAADPFSHYRGWVDRPPAL
jgi:hypothetical protein